MFDPSHTVTGNVCKTYFHSNMESCPNLLRNREESPRYLSKLKDVCAPVTLSPNWK